VKTKSEIDRVAAAFEERASRAEALAETSDAAEAPLMFAAGLYRAQGALAGAIASAHRTRALTGRLDLDAAGFVDAMHGLLRFAAEAAPPELAAVARERTQEDPTLLRSRFASSWTGKTARHIDYLSRALLRPYLEMLAVLHIRPDEFTPPPAESRTESCPFCGGPPWIAARRAAPDSDGAPRYLGCALCGGQWTVNRLRCPACSEENPDKLPCFRSDRYPAARIEACETCRSYVKSLDLTEDGRLIPEVDDLVSLAMDLWAIEEGFTRIEPGLAGV
jgi:formate dehydrogenase accessory protein FdhE